MKYLIIFFLACSIMAFRFFEDIYKIELKTMDGQKLNLGDFKGKKILFVTVPLSDRDTSLSLTGLVELEQKYYESLVVIGIPAEDIGYNAISQPNLKKLYKDQKPN